MKISRGLAFTTLFSLLLGLGSKAFYNHFKGEHAKAVVNQICHSIKGRAQIGESRIAFDQASAVLNAFGNDSNAFATLKEGPTEIGPQLQALEAKSYLVLGCRYATRPDFNLNCYFSKVQIFDWMFLAMFAGYFVSILIVREFSTRLFAKATLTAHQEFSAALAGTFEIRANEQKSSILGKIISRMLLPGNEVIDRVKKDLRDYQKQQHESGAIQAKLTELKTNNERLSERRKEVSETLRGVRHDIESPLSYLRTHGICLVEEGSVEADIYNLSLNKVETTLREINQFMDIRLNTAKETSLEVAECLIHESVRSKKAVWQKRKKFDLSFEYDSSKLSPIEVVPTLFSRAIDNILENSLQALGPTGRISIKCKRMDGILEIEIADNGKGISQSILSDLGKTLVTFGKKSGNGIGLSSAKASIESWGGALSIVSGFDQGTTITICLPIVHTNARFIANLEGHDRRKLAVVDDDKSFSKRFLKRTGTTGEVFESISEYVNWLSAANDSDQRTHVFDLHLGTGSGLDLVRIIPCPDQAILLTNDYNNPDAVEVAGEFGVRIFPKVFL